MPQQMKDIIIVCEDSYGLDVYSIIEAVNGYDGNARRQSYNVIGFISDNPGVLSGLRVPAPVLGSITEWVPKDGTLFVMGIRDPLNKEKAAKLLEDKGAHFETIIAPWVLLPQEFEVGRGCMLANYNCKHGSRFGNFVIADSAMCESVEVGDYSTLCPFVNITNARIGKRVFVESHAVVMEHRNVGDDSHLLPGSVVITNVKAGNVVAGVPGKRFRGDFNRSK